MGREGPTEMNLNGSLIAFFLLQRREQNYTYTIHAMLADEFYLKPDQSKLCFNEQCRHLKDHWISSRVFPLVSGTQSVTDTTVSADTTA